MKKVVVASLNPVKIKIAEEAFALVFKGEQFQFVGVEAPSGVPDQPMDDEARMGATNRLQYVVKNFPDADFWIAQEGGIFLDNGRMSNRAWITAQDKEGFVATASTSNFYLPKKIEEFIKSGMELSKATDKFFNTLDAGRGKSSVLGCLTDEIYNRVSYYLQPAVIALSEIKHKEWFV